MRKRIFVLLVLMLLMVACGSAEYEEVNCEAREASIPTEIEVSSSSISAPIPVPAPHVHEDVPMPTDPHPFATALREYMAGYDGVVRAYLATLDDGGTMGVLTTRPTTRILVDYDSGEYGYGSSGTLFYLQDGDLVQIDVSGWLFVAGKYNRLMERIYTHTHVVEFIYKLEFGRLEISTRLEYFSDEYLSMLYDDYNVVTESIAERNASAEYAREKYGLVALPPPSFGHMRNAEDQTVQILTMTINCANTMMPRGRQQDH